MLPRLDLNITMGFYFFPRGGSAQVVRYLCRALGGTHWTPTLLAGSMGALGGNSNADRFFTGIDCRSLDYSTALAAWRAGADPMSTAVPISASFEDKADVPDRVFFNLDDAAFDRQVASWTRFFAGQSEVPSVVHLHHLTPMHEAARTVWPNVPVVTHLHGTELKMISAGRDGTSGGASGPWRHEWVERMQRWAGESDRVVVIAPHDRHVAQELLPVDPARIVTVANGVDTEVFAPRTRTSGQRLALWRRCLVDEPRGWRPGGTEGSIRYAVDDLSAFTDPDGLPVPVVLFAGRFMKFKRLQLLIEAHHLMRSTTQSRSVLVVAGGFPCEWEDEHPYDTVQRLGVADVFFVGWRDHHDLAEMLNCSDVFAAPSVEEPFGLVYLEAMASGIPPIATNTGGPMSFINVDPNEQTGWLVAADDVPATARALEEAVGDRASRELLGKHAAEFVRNKYSWASTARAFAEIYDDVSEESKRSGRSQPDRSSTSRSE